MNLLHSIQIGNELNLLNDIYTNVTNIFCNTLDYFRTSIIIIMWQSFAI